MIFGTSTIGVSGWILRFCSKLLLRYYSVAMPISVSGCWSVARICADRAFSYRKPNSTLPENAIASITGCFMARRFRLISLTMFTGALFAGSADVLSRPLQDSNSLTPIVEAAPTLAPFQHVRFCLRYPSDCKANPTEDERIDLDAQTTELLKRVNHSVNISIIPTPKSYGPNLGDGWTTDSRKAFEGRPFSRSSCRLVIA